MWAMQTGKKDGFQDVSVFCPPEGVETKIYPSHRCPSFIFM